MNKMILAALAAWMLLAGTALAELTMEYNDVSEGFDSLGVFSVREELPEGETAEGISEEAARINKLLAERLHMADAVRIYTQGGTRDNHEREMTIRQTGAGFSLGGIASFAIFWDGIQPDGLRGSSILTAAIDLNTGEELTFDQLFDDADAAAEAMEAIIGEHVLGELSDYMEHDDLLPMPRELFYFDDTGLTIGYPAERYCGYDGKAGAVHFFWYELKEFIGENSPLYEISRMMEDSADAVREVAQAGSLGSAFLCSLGDRLGEALSRYAQLADPDYTRGTKVYAFSEPALRGIAVEIPKYADTEDEETPISVIRTTRMNLYGLTTGTTTRGEIVEMLGEPAETRVYSGAEAEDWMLVPGESLLYRCGDNVLQAHMDGEGVLSCILLRDAMPE